MNNARTLEPQLALILQMSHMAKNEISELGHRKLPCEWLPISHNEVHDFGVARNEEWECLLNEVQEQLLGDEGSERFTVVSNGNHSFKTESGWWTSYSATGALVEICKTLHRSRLKIALAVNTAWQNCSKEMEKFTREKPAEIDDWSWHQEFVTTPVWLAYQANSWIPEANVDELAKLAEAEVRAAYKVTEAKVRTAQASPILNEIDPQLQEWADDIKKDRDLKLKGFATRSPERMKIYSKVSQRSRDNPTKHAKAVELLQSQSVETPRWILAP